MLKSEIQQGKVLQTKNTLLTEVSKKIKDSFQESKPDKVNVELGFELSVESGELSALLVKGSGKANLKINLEWTNLNDK